MTHDTESAHHSLVAETGRPVAERLADARHDETELEAWIDELESRYDIVEEQVHAFVPEPGRFARLRREARDLVRRFPEPDRRPTLFGLPVGIKDVFHVDGFETRAGSRLPPEALAGPQADVVTRLQAAGALILGKVACTELAYFGPGPTCNPHAPNHTPGGSSSGSAAAVAAGLAPITLGTQTIGSIGRPAAYCGVVGFKPSYDRVSRAGLVPLAPGADHVGWFASSARDAASLGPVLLGAAEAPEPHRNPVLAVASGPYLDRAEPAGRRRFDAACEHLRRAGLRLVDAELPFDFERVVDLHRSLVAAQAFQTHGARLDTHRELLHPKTVILLEDGRKVSDTTLEAALASRETTRRLLAGHLRNLGADLWLSPPAPGPAPAGLQSTGDPIMNLPWTHSGLPTLVLPDRADTKGSLPTGLQLAAPFGADLELLAWGEGLENLLDASSLDPHPVPREPSP